MHKCESENKNKDKTERLDSKPLSCKKQIIIHNQDVWMKSMNKTIKNFWK